MPTRTELTRAMRQAKLPGKERYVLDALLSRADNATGEIPARFQPRSHSDEYFFGEPRRTVQRALLHLREHGWVDWKPVSTGARGRPSNHYTVAVGIPCDPATCRVRERERIKRHRDAERATIKAPEEPVLSATVPRSPQARHLVLLKGSEGEGEGRDVPQPRCDLCGNILDPVLPANGYRTHPCCDPHEESAAWPRLVSA